MTRTARQPVSLVLDAAPAWPVVLVWDLSARAGGPLASRHGSVGDRAVAVELAITPGPDDGMATVTFSALLASGGRLGLLVREGVPTRWARGGGFAHVEAEGAASATWRDGREGAASYARCGLVGACGVPAGSYTLRRHSR